MSEIAQEAAGVKGQYGAQVAADLEHNTTEQGRIRAELTALEGQLQALQHDHELLLGLQQALGAQAETRQGTDGTTDKKAADVPQPRAEPAEPKASVRKKAAAAAKASRNAPGGKNEKAPVTAAQPTLVSVVRDHLGELSEPRSAVEIAAALAQAHPDRDIKTTVVRTTLEGLVAKAQAHRAKQGSSVFYSSVAAENLAQRAETAALPAP